MYIMIKPNLYILVCIFLLCVIFFCFFAKYKMITEDFDSILVSLPDHKHGDYGKRIQKDEKKRKLENIFKGIKY